MFKSIYKKISCDFNYLDKYGYTFSYDVKHYVVPSVVFENVTSAIRIGFNYESDRIYIQWFPLKESLHGKQLLDNIDFPSNSYKEQVKIATAFLKNFLDGKYPKDIIH